MAPGKGNAVVDDLTRPLRNLESLLGSFAPSTESLTTRADETAAKLTDQVTATVTAKLRGWLLAAALGVGAAAGFSGGAFVLLLHGGQLALVPWLGAVGAPLALGGGILVAIAAAAWWFTRPKPKTKRNADAKTRPVA